MAIALLIVGLVLLTVGAEVLVRGASGLARAVGLPSLVIGLSADLLHRRADFTLGRGAVPGLLRHLSGGAHHDRRSSRITGRLFPCDALVCDPIDRAGRGDQRVVVGEEATRGSS